MIPIIRIITLILYLLTSITSIYLTASTYSVTPDYASSPSSTYSFLFTTGSPFFADFDVYFYFPNNFILTSVSNCAFLVNDIPSNSATCAVNPSTNQIIFTDINITQQITNITIQFNTSTAQFSGFSSIIISYYNTSTNTSISDLSNQLSISITNAIMSCSISSTSNIVGANTIYTITYTPLVPIYPNSIAQIQLQPWSSYSLSNFISNSPAMICNNLCTVSPPSNNQNISELLIFSSFNGINGSNLLILNNARNPPSTYSISFTMVINYKLSTAQYQYQNCTTNFNISTPNTFQSVSFTPTNTTISATNTLTLYLQPTNPISSLTYLKIQPGILKLTYNFNNTNSNTQPTQNPSTNGSLLISNLTSSTTTAPPTFFYLSTFTLVNPPYANKPVKIYFSTSNLISSTFYQIDSGSVSIVSTPSTIIQSNISISITSINSLSTYTLWFITINQLIPSSFIIITFPTAVAIANSSGCSLNGFSSICTVINSNQINITLNTGLSPNTNLTVTVNTVLNPGTTTPTSSITITTYYEDSLSVVDQLTDGLSIISTPVYLKSATLTSQSTVVGQTTNYTLTIQITNNLPAGSTMDIIIPTTSFPVTNIHLSIFTINSVSIPSCTLSNITSINLQFSSGCFPNNLPALSNITVILTNITNPTSTKPSDSWQVQTLSNNLANEYLKTGISVTMLTPTQITTFNIYPFDQTVNSITTYTFFFIFKYPHYSGDSIILTFPSTITINTGFICQSQTLSTSIQLQCLNKSQSVLQINFTFTNPSTITQLNFTVSNILNNWYATSSTFIIQTTTNQSTLYYVEQGQGSTNFVAATLIITVANNQSIVLLDQSNISVTISCPFSLAKATNTSQLYLIVTVPSELTLNSGSCLISNPSSCTTSGQNINITGFSDLPLTITFQADTAYFNTNTSPFQIQLNYGDSPVALNKVATVSSFCISPCKKCTSIPTQCLSCLPLTYTINIIYFNNTCLPQCPSTYYSNSIQCLSCNTSACYQCTNGPNNCTSCPSDLYLFQNSCVTQCEQQYYGANNRCIRCNFPCGNCNASDSCLTCVQGYLDLDNKCVTTCSNKSYIGLNGICQICIYNCLTCSITTSNCTSCQKNQLVLYNNTCIDSCPDKYYNNSNAVCIKCSSPCNLCKSDTSCLSCQEGFFMYNGNLCKSNCPAGTVPLVDKCQTCQYPCSTCSIIPTNCTSCTSSFNLNINQCVSQCPPPTKPVNKICSICMLPCITCSSSPSTCKSCISGKYLMEGQCVDTCPTSYYISGIECLRCSNNCNIVYFPVLITSLVVIFIVILSKMIVKQTVLVTSVAALLPPLQLTIWIYVLSQLFHPDRQTNINYPTAIALLIFAIILYFLLSIIFLIINKIKLIQDQYVLQWATSNIHYYTIIIISILQIPFSFKFYRIIYSRVFGANNLSLSYKNQSNIFIITTSFTLLFVTLCQIVAIVSCWTLIYNKQVKDQTFYSCIEALIVTILAMIFSLIDIYKPADYFNDYQLNRQMSDISKIQQHSSMNKIDESVPVSHEESSTVYVDKFVSCSAGKLMHHQNQKLDELKEDYYFEDNDENNKTVITDNIQNKQNKTNRSQKMYQPQKSQQHQPQPQHQHQQNQLSLQNQSYILTQSNPTFTQPQYPTPNDPTFQKKKINIFSPIIQQNQQLYENQKYNLQSVNTQLEVQKNKRKLKSIASDTSSQQQIPQTITNNPNNQNNQINHQQNFDDRLSLLDDRNLKKKWNELIDQKILITQKLYNKNKYKTNKTNLAPINQPSIEQDNNQINQNNIDDYFLSDGINSNQKRGKGSSVKKRMKRKRKKKIVQYFDPWLQKIYLQRLTDKKKT